MYETQINAGAAITQAFAKRDTMHQTIASPPSAKAWQHRCHVGSQTPNAPCGTAHVARSRHAFRSRMKQTACASSQFSMPDRRAVLQSGAAAMLGMLGQMPQAAFAADADSLQADADSPPKLTGLTVQQVLERVKRDFQEQQYYVTGNFSPELFMDEYASIPPIPSNCGVDQGHV